MTSGRKNFEFDFCDEPISCSPDNLNRGSCFLFDFIQPIPSFFQYYNQQNIGGWPLIFALLYYLMILLIIIILEVV